MKTPAKKKIKVMTVPMPKQESKPKAVETIIMAMASLQASQGWAIIVGILEDNIAYLDKCIIDKVDPLTQISLSDSDVELLRVKRLLNIEVKDTPKNYTEAIEAENAEPEEFDPYFKTNKHITDYNKRANEDDRG
jgi:hypothetical protein